MRPEILDWFDILRLFVRKYDPVDGPRVKFLGYDKSPNMTLDGEPYGNYGWSSRKVPHFVWLPPREHLAQKQDEMKDALVNRFKYGMQLPGYGG